MSAYMKKLFPFCGVSSPERKKLSKELLKESKKWHFSTLKEQVFAYYAMPEREYQYIAIDLLVNNVKRFDFEEMVAFIPLIIEKSWWDSVDGLRKFFMDWTFIHMDELQQVFALFYQHENFWMRRVGINLQLKFKEKTDTKILEQAILADLSTDEFFIQKAIGWSLREYSKTDPDWVRNIINKQRFSKLAVKEGSKYL